MAGSSGVVICCNEFVIPRHCWQKWAHRRSSISSLRITASLSVRDPVAADRSMS
jgi:hypothetical protein